MTVIAGILLYVAGVVSGISALALHIRDVQKAVSGVERRKDAELTKLRAAYERLQEDAGLMQQASDCADAYRKGRAQGRAHPMSEAERFARTFEGKKATFVDTTKGVRA